MPHPLQQTADPRRIRPDFERDPASRHGTEPFLNAFVIRADSLFQRDLPAFIHHAVPAVAISQIQSDGQFRLRNIPALLRRYRC